LEIKSRVSSQESKTSNGKRWHSIDAGQFQQQVQQQVSMMNCSAETLWEL